MTDDDRFALESLFLPDSPVILRAVCLVAELLAPLDATCSGIRLDKSMVRFRVARQAVRSGLPIEFSRLQFLWRFDVDVAHTAADAALSLPRVDWLGQAKAALEAADIDPGTDAQLVMALCRWSSDSGRQRGEPKEGAGTRWGAVWRPRPRTEAEREELLRRTKARIANLTAEEKAAAMERRT